MIIVSIPVRAIDKVPPISIKVNEHYIFMDSKPILMKDSVYVPLRFVANALNAEVIWDSETKQITINDADKSIQLSPDSTTVLVNDEQYELEMKPPVVDNRTLVPIRFIAENMDCQVDWNQETYTVEVSREGIVVPAVNILNRGYSDDDLHLLAKIVTVEAMDLSFDGKIAVANVVINRKKHAEFPNTIKEVIYDKKYGVQFPPAYKSSFATRVPSSDSIIAAKMALEGVNNISTCLFFNHRPFSSKANDFYKKIDGEYFYY